jgi:hypothetical protein
MKAVRSVETSRATQPMTRHHTVDWIFSLNSSSATCAPTYRIYGDAALHTAGLHVDVTQFDGTFVWICTVICIQNHAHMSVHLLFWRWNRTALSDLRRPADGPSQVVEWTRNLMKHSEKPGFTSTFSTVNPMFSARIEPGLSGWEAGDQPSEPWQGQTKGSHCRSSVSCGWDSGPRSWKWRLYGHFLRSRTPKKL